MVKFISVSPVDNYILGIVTDDNRVLKFDVLAELKRIPSYKPLYDVDFFKQAHYKNERIYWDYGHKFHIDQVIAKAKILSYSSVIRPLDNA